MVTLFRGIHASSTASAGYTSKLKPDGAPLKSPAGDIVRNRTIKAVEIWSKIICYNLI